MMKCINECIEIYGDSWDYCPICGSKLAMYLFDCKVVIDKSIFTDKYTRTVYPYFVKESDVELVYNWRP